MFYRKKIQVFASILLIAAGLALGPVPALAQVAVNTDGAEAHPSAMLDVKSTTRGALFPRLNGAQRAAIAAPAEGLLVFDTDSKSFWFFDGTAWVELIDIAGPPVPAVISPPLIVTTAHDYNPAGFADAGALRLSADNGLEMITGFSAQTNGAEKTLVNVGAHTFYLAPEHTGSAAANRIAYFEEVMIPPGASCRILYDGVAQRWRPVATPCPGYSNLPRSVHYDKSAGKDLTAAADDIHLESFGSLSPPEVADPSPTSPFGSWDFGTGTTASGGVGLFYPKQTEDMAYTGSAHIVTKMHFKAPAALSDNTNSYYVFLRIADLPSSGFWNQNNSLGIRYRHITNGGKWECYARSAAGVDTTVDSGVLFEVNKEYELLVTLNKNNSEATFFINNAVVGRITTNLPAPISVGVSNHLEKTAGTSARSLLVYRFMGAAIEP